MPLSHGIATSGKTTLLDNSHIIGIMRGMAKRRSKKLSDQVRQAIDDSGLTRYKIAKATGIDQSALGRFYHGQQGLTTGTLDLVGEYLKLTITLGRKPSKKGK